MEAIINTPPPGATFGIKAIPGFILPLLLSVLARATQRGRMIQWGSTTALLTGKEVPELFEASHECRNCSTVKNR